MNERAAFETPISIRPRWIFGGAIALTAALIATGCGPDRATSSDEEERERNGPFAEVDCEHDSDEEQRVLTAISPSGRYFAGSVDDNPTLWHDDKTTEMFDADGNDPDSPIQRVISVNDSGIAAGQEIPAASADKGWRWRDGAREELRPPDGWTADEEGMAVSPEAVNSDGMVVGSVEGEDSDGKRRSVPVKWEPDSTEAVELNLDDAEAGAAGAITGDRILGYTTDDVDDPDGRLAEWDLDGKQRSWDDAPEAEDPEVESAAGDWVVYTVDGDATSHNRHNLDTGEHDTLPEDFVTGGILAETPSPVDENGNVYGTLDNGHAGFIAPDQEQFAFPMPAEDEEHNKGKDVTVPDPGTVTYAVAAVSRDGTVALGGRQQWNEGPDAPPRVESRVWNCA